MTANHSWTLNKVLVLLMTAAYLALVVDLRSEHVDVVRHHWTAWIPIVYSGIMVVLGAIGLATWERGGRLLLTAAFAASFVVGGLGFWFHNDGHLITAVTTTLAAWVRPLHHQDAPPALAPLAFAGLGLIGMLACARGFQPALPSETEAARAPVSALR